MTRQQNRIGLALAVPIAGLAMLVLLLTLALRSGGGDGVSMGAPLVLGALVVVATLFGIVWQAVKDRQHADH